MRQLLKGIGHLHQNRILHRGLHPCNILYTDKGEVKIGDFGLARECGSPLRPDTPQVVPLSYRALELILGTEGKVPLLLASLPT